MAHSILLLIVLISACARGSEEDSHPWKGVQTAKIVVQGDGVTVYNAEAIKSLVEFEFRKAGLRCIDINQPSGGVPTVAVVAQVDGLLVHDKDGRLAGCIFNWSLTASTWAHQVILGSGAIVLEEHHNIGFGSSREFPADFSSGFSQLSDTMVSHWLRDNPR